VIRRSLFRDSASLAIGNLALVGSAGITSLMAARWLGPEGKGELALALAVGALLGPIATGGVDTYVAARWGSVPEPYRAALQRTAHFAGWLGGLALATATLAYTFAIGLGPTLVLAAAMTALVRPSLAVRQSLRLADGRIGDLTRAAGAAAACNLVLALILTASGATPARFVTAAGASSAVAIAMLGFPRRRSSAAESRRLSAELRSDVRRFGSTTVLADGLQLASYRIDLLILAAFVPVPAIGVYSVAVLIAELLWQLPNAVARSVLSRLASYSLTKREVILIGARVAVTMTGLAAVAIVVVDRTSGALLGDGYQDASRLLLLLAPGIVLLGAAKPMAAWTLNLGYAKRNLAASGIGLAVALIADLILIPSIGTPGAAIASSLSYAATGLAVFRMMPRGPSTSSTPPTPTTAPELTSSTGASRHPRTWPRRRRMAVAVRAVSRQEPR
jgi:O-antigen/teichoic acid export membrane protein